MNLTWHIVRKDLRRLVWPWTGWIVAIVAMHGWMLDAASMPAPADSLRIVRWSSRLASVADVMALVQALVTALLTARLIQEDALCGTTAPWMTRPISILRLLRAKMITGAALFVVAPVAAGVPFWIGAGFSARELGFAILEMTVFQGLVVTAAVAIAAVTTDLGSFLLGALTTGILLGASWGVAWLRAGAALHLSSTEFMMIITLVAGPVAAAGSVGVLIRGRNPTLARAVLVGVVVVLVALQAGMSRNAASGRLPDWWRSVTGTKRSWRVDVQEAELRRRDRRSGAAELSVVVSRPASNDLWVVPAGSGWLTHEVARSGFYSAPVSRAVDWGGELGRSIALGMAPAEKAPWRVLCWSNAEQWNAVFRGEQRFSPLGLQWGAVRAVVAGEVPWRSGAEVTTGSSRWGIAAISTQSGEAERVAYVVEREPWITVDSGAFRGVASKNDDLCRHDLFFLVDRERKHAVRLVTLTMNAWRSNTVVTSVRRLEISMQDFPEWRDATATNANVGLQSALLVRVRLLTEDRFWGPMLDGNVALIHDTN